MYEFCYKVFLILLLRLSLLKEDDTESSTVKK